jgi:hypothetical protein
MYEGQLPANIASMAEGPALNIDVSVTFWPSALKIAARHADQRLAYVMLESIHAQCDQPAGTGLRLTSACHENVVRTAAAIHATIIRNVRFIKTSC